MKLSIILKQLLRKGYKVKTFQINCENDVKVYIIEPEEIEFEDDEIIINSPPTLIIFNDTENYLENEIFDNKRKFRINKNQIIIELEKEKGW